jgi:hypothetical protein
MLNIKLFDKEVVDFKTQVTPESDDTQTLTDEAINKKYIDGEVRIITESARYPLDSIVTMIESKKYNLNPDFQRRRRWDKKRKSRLIESFIMNVPVPPIFLYEVKFATYEVMDGQQRMSTIYDFYKNEFQLQGLQQWKELNGKNYTTLPDQVRAGIDRRYISSIILLKETGKTIEQERNLKKLVFERLNSGGIQLEPQETRNALYDGKLNQLCIKLSKNPIFKKLLKIQDFNENSSMDNDNIELTPQENEEENKYARDIYSKMDDIELVLRFFAYRHISSIDNSSLTDILDKFLIQGNNFDDSVLQQYEDLFNNTITLVLEILEDTAFQLYRTGRKGSKNENQWDWSEKPMKVVYDPIMQAFSQFVDYRENLHTNKQNIQADIKEFYQKNSELFEGRRTTTNDVAKRIEATMIFLEKYI